MKEEDALALHTAQPAKTVLVASIVQKMEAVVEFVVLQTKKKLNQILQKLNHTLQLSVQKRNTPKKLF